MDYLEAVDLTDDTERLSVAAQRNTHMLKGAGEGEGIGRKAKKKSTVILGASFFAHKLHMKEKKKPL